MYISILLKPSTRFRYPPDDPFGSGSLGRGVASTVRRVSYFGLRGRLRGGTERVAASVSRARDELIRSVYVMCVANARFAGDRRMDETIILLFFSRELIRKTAVTAAGTSSRRKRNIYVGSSTRLADRLYRLKGQDTAVPQRTKF